MKIVLHYDAGPGLKSHLTFPGLTVACCPEPDDASFAHEMRDAEVLWHVLKPCTAEVIAGAPKLRLIQKIGIGVNTIDLDAARARGIAVCNLPGSNAPAVAEMALLLMLATLRRLPMFDARLRAGQWATPPLIQDSLGELHGRTVGLIGYGAIPQHLAPILAAMGCKLLYTARSPKPGALATYVDRDTLLAQADIVSLHIPLTPETERCIDAAAIARMKPGAILINTARGGLVDQTALTAALASGHLAAAGLDVFVHEPADPADPLFALDNVVAAPHVAWVTSGTFQRSFATAAENCRRLAAGEPLLNQVA
ncbi:MAG: 2-hydroxyacid dehydrogenase [Alphaproteobacteria bacterium]|nr:2-hydroxyacid dehydrogenase [Alphaproteobacteria bacterium]